MASYSFLILMLTIALSSSLVASIDPCTMQGMQAQVACHLKHLETVDLTSTTRHFESVETSRPAARQRIDHDQVPMFLSPSPPSTLTTSTIVRDPQDDSVNASDAATNGGVYIRKKDKRHTEEPDEQTDTSSTILSDSSKSTTQISPAISNPNSLITPAPLLDPRTGPPPMVIHFHLFPSPLSTLTNTTSL